MEYKFEPESFDLSLRVGIKSYWQAILNRKIVAKQFCHKNGIEYLPAKNEEYHLPNSYLIEPKSIEFFGNVRDDIILKQYEDYKNKQNEILGEIEKLSTEIEMKNRILSEEKQALTGFKNSLRATKNSLEKIYLQNQVEVQKTKIENLEQRKTEKRNRYDSLMQRLSDNKINWKKQVELVDGVIDAQIEKYIRSVTKIIRNRLNFAEFKYNRPEYGKSVEEILSGENYEKAKK